MTKKRIALKILRRVGICILTTVVLLLIGLFGVVRIMEFGPSKTARNLFVNSAMESSAGGILVTLFFSDEEIARIRAINSIQKTDEVTDSSLISDTTILTQEEKSKIVNLIKNLEITGINQVWTTDITYIKTIDEGNYYLITYMDAYSRKIVAWNLEEHQTSNEMIETLKKAVDERNPEPGLIIHSDKGSQMRSESYREFISSHNFAYSYTSLNHSCDENAAQESFHASLKKECIYQHKIRNYLQAYSLIYNYIENFYNTKRIHSSINYLSPCDFEKSLHTD